MHGRQDFLHALGQQYPTRCEQRQGDDSSSEGLVLTMAVGMIVVGRTCADTYEEEHDEVGEQVG